MPWYDTVLQLDDEGLFKERESRKIIFAKILEDLDYAIENCQTEKSTQLITKWTALAYKSRMCLFEGTFRKYHGLGDWEEILATGAAAAEELIDSGIYTIHTSSPDQAYRDIVYRRGRQSIGNDSSQTIRCSRTFCPFGQLLYSFGLLWTSRGSEKSLVNSYLMRDGSRFTDRPNYQTMEFFEETQNRDPRLAQTIRTPGYKRIGENGVSVPDFATSVTGYQYVKYVLAPSFDAGQSSNDMPIMRYAEVLLNYAETKAELGQLSQGDLDRSIKLLRDRVAMPNLNLEQANASPDPYLLAEYPNVNQGAQTGVILEIRRERRVELVKKAIGIAIYYVGKRGKG